MQSSAIPAKFPSPFANNAGAGFIRPIPTASQISVSPGAAPSAWRSGVLGSIHWLFCS